MWPLASELHLHMCLALHGDTDFSYGTNKQWAKLVIKYTGLGTCRRVECFLYFHL